MSQTTNIDQRNKTVTLDSLQLKEVDQGLRNERRQRQRIAELESALRSKDSIIRELTLKNDKLVENLVEKVNQINTASDTAVDASNDLYEVEKKKSNQGFYLGLNYSTEPFNSLAGEITWVRSRMIIGVGLGQINIPDIDTNIYYQFRVGIKLF